MVVGSAAVAAVFPHSFVSDGESIIEWILIWMAMKLLLFDIDGTLVLTGGAGKRAMNRVFLELYGIGDILDDITLSGRTDDRIMMDAYEKAGLEFSYAELARFKQRYFELIHEELAVPHNGKRLMPGVADLLQKLRERRHVHLGLLTGNWEQGGRAKIGHFGLNDYFAFGAFADDSAIRSELVPVARERFTMMTGHTPDAREVFVIGDTPADIECAKPHGVVSVAVAAAGHSLDDLRPFAPDYLLPDLTDDRALDILG